jgi:hypothetical protein
MRPSEEQTSPVMKATSSTYLDSSRVLKHLQAKPASQEDPVWASGKLVEFLYTKEERAFEAKNPPQSSVRNTMAALTSEQQTQAQELAQILQQAIADELLAMAQLFVAKPATHQLFGETELQLRDLVHRLAANALTTYLAQKKTATSAPP